VHPGADECPPPGPGTFVTCKRCKSPMAELKGHIYHKKRKFRCSACGRIRMQKPRPQRRAD